MKKYQQNLFSLFSVTLFLSTVCSVASFGQNNPSMVQNNYSPSPVAIRWANRGVDLANQGDYPAAVEALYEAWKLTSENYPLISKNLSVVYNNYSTQLLAENQDPEKAVLMLRRAIFFDENNKVALQNLDSAVKQLGIEPNDYKARLKEARNLRVEGYVDESVSEYLKAVKLAKDKKDELQKIKLEMAQVYQVIYSKYSETPVGEMRLQKLKELIASSIKENPKDERFYILEGRAFLAGDKLIEAIDSFEKALTLKQDDRKALEGLIASWRRVVQIAPNEAQNLVGLSGALARAGNIPESEQLLQKARTLAPNNPEVNSLINANKEREKEAETYRIAQRALEAQKEGKYEQAIDLYKLILNKLPEGEAASNIHYNLGLAYQQNGSDELAYQSFKNALQTYPANLEAKQALKGLQQKDLLQKAQATEKAIEQQATGNLDGAISSYLSLLRAYPQDAQLNFNLGTAYQERKQYQKALIQYQKAAQLEPKNSEFKNALQVMQDAIDSGAFEEVKAREILDEAVKLQQAGKIQQSIIKYQEAIAIDPQSAQAHFNLGTALHSQSKTAEAISQYRVAYSLDSIAYTEANFYIANLLEIEGKEKEAITYYRQYLDDAPNGEFAEDATSRIEAISAG
ncbi:MAG TPA: tetratricopeptide repeat protein [Vampirovibrionales bacterium]